MEAIRTERLTKSYGNVQAVRGIDLSVKKGELFALLGVNGAGKTTTIKMLTGLAVPSGGKAFVLGEDITKAGENVRRAIGISPQESAVAGNLTVFENLCFMAEIYGFSKAEAREKANEIMRGLSLFGVAEKRAKTLSGGFTRRLSVAMALVTEPELLFLDEPTLGLDVLARRELWKIIEDLKGKITVILTTHYLEEAQALADRLAVMSNGEVVACGTAEEIENLAGSSDFTEAFVKLINGDFCAKKGTNAEEGAL